MNNFSYSLTNRVSMLRKQHAVAMPADARARKKDKSVAPQENLLELFDLWQFTNSPGTLLDGVNLSFDSSSVVQIDWGDGSVETIDSNTNYTHTLA